MIDRKHTLPIARQAELLGISRGAVYYLPQPVSAADLRLMRRIDELHLEHPFLGARLLRDVLNREGFAVGRKHVATLMRRMGIEPLYRKPNTSKKHPGHAVYPYLLRGLAVERANHVWAMDITYIPMAQGFVYLCAVVDWASRRVLAHRVSITQHGRQGRVARQRICRAAVAHDQVRRGVPARLRVGQPGPRLAGTLHRVLQHTPAALEP